MQKITKKKLGGFVDNRGHLFWFDKNDLEFGHNLNYITTGTIEPECVRGGHYHKNTEERIVCVLGEILFKLDDEETVLYPGDVVSIPKGSTHTLINTGETTAVFVEIKSKVVNKENMDTYKR